MVACDCVFLLDVLTASWHCGVVWYFGVILDLLFGLVWVVGIAC